MKNLLQLAAILAGVLITVSCGLTGSEPKEAPKPPSWFTDVNQIPQDARFLYGTASSSNKDRAVELALNNIAAGISVDIQSESTAQRFKSNTSTSSSYQESVQSKVKSITFTQREIVKQENVGGTYYTMVRVPKANVLSSQKSKFEEADSKIVRGMDALAGYDPINRVLQAVKLRPDVEDNYSQIYFVESLKGLDPFSEFDENNSERNKKRYEKYLTQINSVVKETVIGIYADEELLPTAEMVKNMLNEEGIESKILAGPAESSLLLNGNETQGSIQGFKSVTSVFSLNIINPQNRASVTSRTFNLTGYSPVNHVLAREDLAKKFKETIQKEGGLVKALNL